MMNKAIFRQYDIRGHAVRDLTDDTVRLIGQAFGTYVQEQGTNEVLVGGTTASVLTGCIRCCSKVFWTQGVM